MQELHNEKAILLVGATGTIGQALCKFLTDKNRKVIVLARNTEKAKRVCPTASGYIDWEYDKKCVALHNVLWQVSDVIFLAGETINQAWSEENRKKIYNSRIEGVRNLLLQFNESNHSITRFIAFSAIGFYGLHSKNHEEFITEDFSSSIDFLSKLCVDWELESLKAIQLGIQTHIVRLAPVLTTKGGMLAKLLPIFKMGLGGNVGTGEQWLSWIHIEDVLEGIYFLLQCVKKDKIYFNFASSNPVEYKEFYKTLASVLWRPAFFTMSEKMIRKVMGEASELIVNGRRIYPEALLREGFHFQYPTIKNALKDIIKNKK